MNVRFLVPAEEELNDAAGYYEAQSPGLGDDFLSEVEKVVRDIVEFPNSGVHLTEGARRKLVENFPFDVVYSAAENELLIIAIAHQRRRPGYWKKR